MIIIIGLGNPGKKFESTRHNVGFMVINEFARKHNFPEFKLNKKSNALISDHESILLAKPQTFMNDSGAAAKNILSKIKNQISNIIIVHDDIDLPVGKIKIVQERGSAGHKGVESIIKAIGNKGLVRIRIGIAPQKEIEAKKIVLKKFSSEEQKNVSQAIDKAVMALNTILLGSLEKAMSEYN